LSRQTSAAIILRSGSGRVPFAVALDSLVHQTGASAKGNYLWRRLFPSGWHMREEYPVARRGPWGLVAAYVCRLIFLTPMVARAARAWLGAAMRARAENKELRQ
jgi:hypothetical protein